jgi:hypothetical protein
MNKRMLMVALVLVLAGLSLAACGGGAEPDVVATQVAVARAVAATLTAEAPAPPPAPTEVALAPTVTLAPTEAPTPTPIEVEVKPSATSTLVSTVVAPTASPIPTLVAPTASPTPLPSPTPITIAVLPADGSDGNRALGNDHPEMDGRNITLPGFSQYDVSQPMVFRDRMVFQVEVRDRDVGPNDGDGIENVRFTITDDHGQQVHFRQENNAGYCVFGGGEPDCNVWGFAQSGYRWPDGEVLFPGNYSVVIDITPLQAEPVTWFWSFGVELAQDMARINNIYSQGDRYAVEFETFGFQPQLPGQHVHFFFDTVPPEQAGMPGNGPWKLYGGGSPFTEYGPADRPSGATQLCVLVANADHSVQANTGNCFPLP